MKHMPTPKQINEMRGGIVAAQTYERLKRERDALKEVANAVTVGYRIGALTGKLAKSTFELAEAGIALCEKGASK